MRITENTDLSEIIEIRMKTIQMQMEANIHMNSPESVMTNILSMNEFWLFLNDEDKDYIKAAKEFVQNKKYWSVP